MKRTARKRKPRILLVEDHEHTLQALVRVLEHRGFPVTSASTMQSAMEALRTQELEVLVCDIALPDGDGWQLMAAFRARNGSLGIAMSGYGTASDQSRSEAAGFACHLIKPFDPETLFEAIDRMC